MDRYYRIGEFARKADVSVRTLQFYDKQGLLAPSEVSESGYRLYTDSDLLQLQQILALKFLGFSLDEIRALRRTGPQRLHEVLAQQKAMMQEKRAHLEAIIQAIEDTESLLQAGTLDWDALARVIQAIQMDNNNEWVKKYFTPEQIQQMEDLSAESYSEEARRKLAERGPWTEADQARADAQWAAVASELKRLSEAGADPSGPEAQAVAQQYTDLISAFTGGDRDIANGLDQWWKNYSALPQEQRPFTTPWGEEEGAFLHQALDARRHRTG